MDCRPCLPFAPFAPLLLLCFLRGIPTTYTYYPLRTLPRSSSSLPQMRFASHS
ncbi:hypothetical protein FIBSPDRAFT_869478 [Athelia psychrophila]|uniref:Uncharacterized protein n=1 Tax=Athelia psychrophila TaxID=1759441 RepID=A0A166C5C1_9AGAM|nr:hypothetical protein FIBSPDRAFT_869478 [Fibularhizoctonia sp. CBS 109695]